MVSACSAPQQTIEIPFVPRYGGQPVSCDAGPDGITMSDLRLYVHDVRLLSADGGEIPVKLIEDPLWQNADVALLDFEHGAGSCINGTAQTNTAIRGRAPAGEYSGIRFRIGVPKRWNHADPLRAGAPLSYSSMHWHWRTGYKFMRAGIASEDDGFWLHLGSSRCEGAASNVTGCRAENRPLARLAGFRPGKDAVIVDVERLVEGIDLNDAAPSDCSSGPAEAECKMPFDALGLDFSTGAVERPATLFHAEAGE
jgi:uncharacterized repeat protein (TIGR04052 family)